MDTMTPEQYRNLLKQYHEQKDQPKKERVAKEEKKEVPTE